MGVYISVDTKLMTELSLAMERSMVTLHKPQGSSLPPGFSLAHWDNSFTDALLRLLDLADAPAESAILGEGRLR
ncbi:AraC family transcriptional regulator N-terminal domain-containing protein, partial [Marinomonas arenicola]|uniref:AraC family transcriptional regulator N-terminal domain-containing protein n=1 Tax=Marinomonas arenicola TaxID=569601 RepID=UPI003C6ED263